MADIHITIIVADEDVEMARAIAAALSPAGFAEFRVGIRPAGDTGPATHWLTSGWLGDQFVALAEDPAALAQVCAQLKLPYTEAQLKAMRERATIRPVAEIECLALLAELRMEVVDREVEP